MAGLAALWATNGPYNGAKRTSNLRQLRRLPRRTCLFTECGERSAKCRSTHSVPLKVVKFLPRIIKWMVIGLASLAVLLPLAGQLGAFQGQMPSNLGVQSGRLKPPSLTPNSVSSQADLYPDHPQREYAQIAPLQLQASAKADFSELSQVVRSLGGCQVIQQDASYLYAQCRTVWLGFVDDLELWHNPAMQRIDVRSASRLGRKDFGVNRARVETLRLHLHSG